MKVNALALGVHSFPAHKDPCGIGFALQHCKPSHLRHILLKYTDSDGAAIVVCIED